MRFLIHATLPIEPANTYVRKGTLGKRIEKIMADLKPEAAYFMEHDGKRSAMIVVQMKDTSDIPKFAEPFFLQFNADVVFHPVMTPADLAKADVDKLGKKWG